MVDESVCQIVKALKRRRSGGDELRVGGFIGDQQRLGGTGKLVDIDDAEDTALGEHHDRTVFNSGNVDPRSGCVITRCTPAQ